MPGHSAGDRQEGQQFESRIIPFLGKIFCSLPGVNIIGSSKNLEVNKEQHDAYGMHLDSLPYLLGDQVFVLEAKTGKIRGGQIEGNAYERLGTQVSLQIHHFLVNPPDAYLSNYYDNKPVTLNSVICMNSAFARAHPGKLNRMRNALDINTRNPTINFRYHLLSSPESYVDFIEGLQNGSLL